MTWFVASLGLVLMGVMAGVVAWRVVAAIDEVVLERPLTERVSREGRYLRYAVKTYLMRFTDDVHGEVHFRSASRVGRDDLGANRTRMRSIVDALSDRFEEEGLAVDR